MPRTSKQIVEKYKGNLDYFRKPHVFRRLRGWCFALAVIGSLAAVLGFRYYGEQEFFNTGPISANHAEIATRCDVCHQNARPDLLSVLKLDRAVENVQQLTKAPLADLPGKARDSLPTIEQVRATASSVGSTVASIDVDSTRAALDKTAQQYLSNITLSRMDQACIRCHEVQRLHQPQMAALALRPVAREIAVVHAAECASCHREHVSHQKMEMPASNSCQSCHGVRERLLQSLTLVKAEGPLASTRAEIRDLGDGVNRFIPPRAVPHRPAVFQTFAKGHPPFGYERADLRDNAVIRYNHWRHDQPDIPQINGRKLDCADCHQPGANGAFYQRISYEQHCASCHSLHFDPDVPKLAIPHGDPEKVRAYLRSLTSQYMDYALNERRVTDRAQLQFFVDTQFGKLRARGIGTAAELEQRVFYTGDPPEDPQRIMTKSNKGQFFAGCAKCHEVTPPAISGAPRITPTQMPDRWLTRGPFTHAPHTHMQCADCHGKVLASKNTNDILLPTQRSCAECHRPLDGDKVQPLVPVSDPEQAHRDLVAKQRREGGIAADCQSCHRFHAPADASASLLQLVEKKK